MYIFLMIFLPRPGMIALVWSDAQSQLVSPDVRFFSFSTRYPKRLLLNHSVVSSSLSGLTELARART